MKAKKRQKYFDRAAAEQRRIDQRELRKMKLLRTNQIAWEKSHGNATSEPEAE